jgi:hypothetical protein
VISEVLSRRRWLPKRLVEGYTSHLYRNGRRPSNLVMLLGLVVSLAPHSTHSQGAPNNVDLAMVLAIDTSGSVSPSRYKLQVEGYAEAFASHELINAIRSASSRAIAVTLVEWSGARQQEQVVDWTLIHDEASSRAFSASLGKNSRSYFGRTSISAAIDFCAALITHGPFQGARKVIDVSGDGSSNDGRPVVSARDDAVAADLTVNGLPILADEATLGDYYQSFVVGGPDSFVIEAADYSHFSEAILKKLVREIARDRDGDEVAALDTR